MAEPSHQAVTPSPTTAEPAYQAFSRPVPEPAGTKAPSPTPELDPAFAQRARPSQPPRLSNSHAGVRVLIVDADRNIRGAIRSRLLETSMTVDEAEDGKQALATARGDKPNLIIIETTLPGLLGFEVCQRLRADEQLSDVPIIALSSFHRGWRIRDDLRDVFGVQHFFEKPLDLDRLITTVRVLAEGKEVDRDPPTLGEIAESCWEAGMEAFEAGDLDQAISHLEQGVDIEPQAFELLCHLGLLYGRRDDLFKAAHALERAITLQANHLSSLKNLAVIYQRAGFRRKATEMWERAMWVAPDDATKTSIKELMLSLL